MDKKLIEKEVLGYKDSYLIIYNNEDEVEFLRNLGYTWDIVANNCKSGDKMFVFPLFPVERKVYIDDKGVSHEEFNILDKRSIRAAHKAYMMKKNKLKDL